MPILHLTNNRTISITDDQWKRIEAWHKMPKPPSKVELNGQTIRYDEVVGLVMPDRPTFGTKAPKAEKIEKKSLKEIWADNGWELPWQK